MNKVFVLGVGPGSPEYIVPVIHRKVQECNVLFGAKRHLEIFACWNKQQFSLGFDLRETIRLIGEMRAEKQIGILVSGDPGLYSFLTTLLNHFDRNDLEVYPGISSLQYLFARGVLPWQDARIVSLHGRRIEDLAELVRKESKLAFLVDNKFPVGEIVRFLVDSGITGKRVLVGENLSYRKEKIQDLSLEEWAGAKTADLSVMVIYDDKE